MDASQQRNEKAEKTCFAFDESANLILISNGCTRDEEQMIQKKIQWNHFTVMRNFLSKRNG